MAYTHTPTHMHTITDMRKIFNVAVVIDNIVPNAFQGAHKNTPSNNWCSEFKLLRVLIVQTIMST